MQILSVLSLSNKKTMSHSLSSKKPMIALYLLLVSIACFGDAYALDDTTPELVATEDMASMPAQHEFSPETNNTQPEQTPIDSHNPSLHTGSSNTLQLLEKLEAINLIASNPAYEHLNDVLIELEKEENADHANESLDFSLIQTSPHELALTQILSEVCPPLIDEGLHEQFTHSYQAHLKLLMPTLDPNLVMPKINEHPEYTKILQGIREWTMGYPDGENKELCIEFAEATF